MIDAVKVRDEDSLIAIYSESIIERAIELAHEYSGDN